MAAISRRLLKAAPTPSSTSESWATEPPPMSVDSDVVVILAALLCAVICFVGLALVARCAWIRRRSSSSSSSPSHPPAPQAAAPNKGLKRKELLSLPRLPFRGSDEKKLSTECAICLAEFADGDEIRVLPPCGHGFHVVCVDTWLKSHSSCPSCRSSLVAAAAASAASVAAAATGGGGRCQRCGACSGVEAPAAEEDVPAAEEAVAASSVADGGEKAQN